MASAAMSGAAKGGATGSMGGPAGIAIGAGMGLLGGLLSKKLSKPPGLTPEGKAAATGLTGVSDAVKAGGQQLVGQGQGLLTQGGQALQRGNETLSGPESYYNTLLRGGAGATAAAIAPDVANVTSVYRGAARSLDRSGPGGANREVAEAELARQRAGQIGGMVLAQRPGAAQALTGIAGQRQQAGLALSQMGVGAMGSGLGAQLGSAGPLSTIYNAEQRRTEQQGQDQGAIGSAFGNFIFDYLRGRNGGVAGGAPQMPQIQQSAFGLR